jgi:hypothetical protein
VCRGDLGIEVLAQTEEAQDESGPGIPHGPRDRAAGVRGLPVYFAFVASLSVAIQMVVISRLDREVDR